MATHDYNIANQGFPAFRADLNDALAAIVSNNSNATAPATTFAHMVWVDTAADPSILKIRNADNDAWITIGSINQTDDKFKLTPADGISTDTISELTSAAGVTVDGVLLKDSGVGSAASPVSLNSLNYPTEGSVNFRNRIINGAMVIDQRNAGASVTVSSDVYTLDRWQALQSQASKYTVQQNAASVTPPTGFINYLGATSSAATSLGASDYFFLQQIIEGLNIADLAWGTANASTVTLSFWVRSSLTGTFGGSLANSSGNRSYPYTFSISSANTWEQKSITVAGDTSGTWLTTNGSGIKLRFGLGVGTTYSGTANAWAGANYFSATGATSVVGTNGATFYITGVQLEVGSVATPFERRHYGTELSLCQRYYFRMIDGGSEAIATGGYYSSTDCRMVVNFPVAMRIAPSVVASSGTDYFRIQRDSGDDTFNTLLDGGPKSPTTIMLFQNTNVSGTAGHAGFVYSNDPNASLAFNAEL